MSGILKRIKVPHVFTLLTGVVFVCSMLTYVIPSGQYERWLRFIVPLLLQLLGLAAVFLAVAVAIGLE
jgi:uncharacterized ion transporter superfamily protein YfcC